MAQLHRHPSLRIAAAVIGAAVLVAACEDGDDLMVVDGPAEQVEIPYDAIAALESYAFTTHLEVTSQEGDLSVQFDGAFQAPDRIQGMIVVRGEPYERLLADVLGQPTQSEIIAVGQHAWWREEDGEWHAARDLSEETRNPLIMFWEYATPEFYLEALQWDSLIVPVAGLPEDVNGVRAYPVRLDKQALVELLPQGTSIKIDPDPDEPNPVYPAIIQNAQQVLPESFLVEVWFEADELYPVRIVFDYEVTEDDYANLSFGFGRPADIRLQMDITDPDADVEIEPPLPIPTEVTREPPPPGATVPSLTAADKEQIEAIALADPRLQEILAGRRYEISGPFFVWHSLQLEKLGGGFYITFDEPFTLEHDWPEVVYDSTEQTQPPFRLTEIHFRAEQIDKLRLRVYLPGEELVEIDPEDAIISNYTPPPPPD